MNSVDRVASVLVQKPGGVNRARLAQLAGVEYGDVSRLIGKVRDQSDVYGDVVITVRRGGEYIYAFASLLDDYLAWQLGRLKRARTAARREEKVAWQAFHKFGASIEAQGLYLEAKQRRERIELEIARLSP